MNTATMPEDANDPNRWTEADSERFAAIGDLYVPAREEQRRVLLELIPAEIDEPFTLVELAAGDGTFAKAVLERFPRCRVLAYDGSDLMLERERNLLAPFGGRVETRRFALERRDWRTALPAPLRCAVSSLAIHHLPGREKRCVFSDLAAHVEPGGALLVADLVEPAMSRVKRIFASQWDDAVRERSRRRFGDERALAGFGDDRWNHYRLDVPDPIDRPSRLVDQLDWLREAGFRLVDCFWMHAGHAIYGGYR
jgi:SAM-dependent methyltransferase